MTPHFIQHRVNKISELIGLNNNLGAEIDLRSWGDSKSPKLHLAHDPWTQGDDFEEWLKIYSSQARGTLILNTKEDGLENFTLELLKKYKITDYFFLDTTLPSLVNWTLRKKHPNFAIRISRFENIIKDFIGTATWVWVDCFDGLPIDKKYFSELKGKFKICLVSPELHGLQFELNEAFISMGSAADAICTKKPDTWKKALENTL